MRRRESRRGSLATSAAQALADASNVAIRTKGKEATV
jgi:hypothetical protein